MRQMRGKQRSKGFNGGLPFPHETLTEKQNLPEQVDWRLYGAVSSVKGTHANFNGFIIRWKRLK